MSKQNNKPMTVWSDDDIFKAFDRAWAKHQAKNTKSKAGSKKTK